MWSRARRLCPAGWLLALACVGPRAQDDSASRELQAAAARLSPASARDVALAAVAAAQAHEAQAPATADAWWQLATRAADLGNDVELAAYVSYVHAARLHARGVHGAEVLAILDAGLQSATRTSLLLRILRVRVLHDLGRVTEAYAELDAAEAALAPTTSEGDARRFLDLTEADLLLAGGHLEAAAGGQLGERATPFGALKIATAAEDWPRVLDLVAQLRTDPRAAEQRAALDFDAVRARARTGATDARTESDLAALAARDDVRSNARLGRAIAVERAAHALLRGEVVAARQLLASVGAYFDQHGPGGQATGFRYAAVRARLLAATGADGEELRAALASLDRAWSVLVAHWRARPDAGTRAFLQFGARRDVLAQQLALRARVDGADAALDAVLAADQLDGFVQRYRIEPPSRREVELLVPPDGGLLVYVPAPLGSCVLVLERGADTVCVDLPSDLALRGEVERVAAARATAFALDAATERAARASLQALAAWALPEALATRLRRWRTVAIVGRELLARLPFDLLPGRVEPYLGDELALAHVPSLTIGAWLARRPVAAVGDVALFAATRPSAASLPALALAEPLDDLAAHFAPDRLRQWRAEAATAGAGRDAAKASAMLVFLGHGSALADGATGLAVADGTVGAHEVLGGGAPPLVCLLICRSGAGMLHRGDCLGHQWAATALAGGARVVALADHDLDAEPTLGWLQRFTAMLPAAAWIPAEAARRASAARSARSLAEALRRPGLHLEGLAHLPTTPLPVVGRSGGRWRLWWPLAGVLLVAVGVAWRRRFAARRPPRPHPGGVVPAGGGGGGTGIGLTADSKPPSR